MLSLAMVGQGVPEAAAVRWLLLSEAEGVRRREAYIA